MEVMQAVFISSAVPRRCGIATFTADLMTAVKGADPSVLTRIAAIDEPNIIRPYPGAVRWRIRQGDVDSYREAARAINRSPAEIVNIQHEFGLYGIWHPNEAGEWTGDGFEDHLTPLLEELAKPSLVTFHTVLPRPTPSVRAAVRSIVSHADGVVVMAQTAIDLLRSDYGITAPLTLIPHGMPNVEAKGRHRLKEKLGLTGRIVISTFGLVDPRKGLEYMIEAMQAVAAKYPAAIYLIAGQTHPELLRTQGEEYRNSLNRLVAKLGLDRHVAFVNEYMEQKDIVEYLLASDVYVTPYLDPNQITSGTLAYALGAGKAIISTPYLHAREALADGRGLLVDFRSSSQLTEKILAVLDDPAYKARLEAATYEYAREMTWPRAGEHFLSLMRQIAADNPLPRPERRREKRPVPAGLGARVSENPLLTPANVAPSDSRFEVVSVLNAGVARLRDETILLLRVAQRARTDTAIPTDALTFDLQRQIPKLKRMNRQYDPGDTIGSGFYDPQYSPPRLTPVFIPKDLPGLDLSDPRVVRQQATLGGFNPPGDEFVDLLTQVSHLRLARSRDGVHFSVAAEPVLPPFDELESYGCEDPRITEIDGTWYITYVGVSALGIATMLATTTDFVTFQRHGVLFLPDHKDVALFPVKIEGQYVALTRPMPQSFSRVNAIWIAYSDDLRCFGKHRVLALPREGMWDEVRVGASAPPVATDAGWLEIYHGVDRNSRYCLGALLLDRKDPAQVLARSPRPIFVPEAEYEKKGLFGNTVFTCGLTQDPDNPDRLRIYYGAADTCLAAADFSTAEILAHLS